jgi:formylglycine-generating enzyme required for sulfatase activity
MKISAVRHLFAVMLAAAMVPLHFAWGAPAPAYVNTLGIEFAEVAPGSFSMGQDTGGDWDERPVHPVHLTHAFLMSVTEITNAQYERFDPDHRALRGKAGLSLADDEAVVFVSWQDAVRFCAWLSEKEGKPYRLPTEAEWEYACRAGTTTLFSTGDELPGEYQRNPQSTEWPVPAPLHVGQTPPNAWGLRDMHGNVEEWCLDWYAPYSAEVQMDPAGPATGDFKIARGGSHNTEAPILRSANRLSTLPKDRHWLIGFRVVIGAMPQSVHAPAPGPPLWAQDVAQNRFDWPPPPEQPCFRGPIRYVKVPENADGPMYIRHNHCPALTACPNGDLLAIWYSTRTEKGRELAIVGARLRRGAAEWEPAAPFWDAADRNDHASALLWDGQDTLYHFNGLCTDATWGKLALILRTSTDNGATWSKARIVAPEHGLRNMPIAGVFMTRQGGIVLPCDGATGAEGGSVLHISRDGGNTWTESSGGAPIPVFAAGASGPRIAGIHAGVAELSSGSLLALGRGNNIEGRMPMSLSEDSGKTWMYAASDLPPVSGGQRIALRRLAEGPLFLASFAERFVVKDAAGVEREVSGLFAALSFDEGQTWPVRRLVTDDGPPREMNGGGNTRLFTLAPDNAEPRGYLASIQTPDGMIHLISSALHYQFNLAWIQQPMPPREPAS